MRLWLLVLVMGAGTYSIRLSMLVFVRQSALPVAAREALRFVTPAVMAAIILPAVTYSGGSGAFDLGLGNERVIAAIVAGSVAWRTHAVWPTIATGMIALWLLRALGV